MSRQIFHLSTHHVLDLPAKLTLHQMSTLVSQHQSIHKALIVQIGPLKHQAMVKAQDHHHNKVGQVSHHSRGVRHHKIKDISLGQADRNNRHHSHVHHQNSKDKVNRTIVVDQRCQLDRIFKQQMLGLVDPMPLHPLIKLHL